MAEAQTPEQAERASKLRKAYGSATTLLREQYRDEFEALYTQEAEALGIEYHPRPTPEQRAEQEMNDLLEKFPHLREQFNPAPEADSEPDEDGEEGAA